MASSKPLTDVNIVDGLSLYDAGERFAQNYGLERTSLDYSKLHQIIERLRLQNGYRPSQNSSLPISYDPKSAGQQRFLTAIERTPFEVDPVDYRDLYVSLPPGMQPKESQERPISSFASRISYALGRLSRHASTHILVVSHSYELLWPLSQVRAANPQSKVAIAYFEGLLDFRWQYSGIKSQNGPIDFFPLDEYTEELFGIEPRFGSATPSPLNRPSTTGLNKY